MKKAIMLLGGALLLAGCSNDQGGSSDTYNAGTGAGSMRSRTNPAVSTPYGASTNDKGAATSPGSSSSGAGSSDVNKPAASSTNGPGANP
jgi:hypothetical protein